MSFKPNYTVPIPKPKDCYSKTPSTPATMLKQHCRTLQSCMLNRQRRTLLRHCCFGNNVEATFDLVAKNGNNIEATGNKVASCFDNVTSTLLLVWTGLKAITCDDFRGTAISPIVSKVFEYCFLERFQSLLVTNDNQFGSKKGVECSHAIYTVRGIAELID